LNEDWKRFADGVSLFLLDDTGVVFSESAQEIYQLNTTATFIWCQLEEGLTPREVTAVLADTYGFSADKATEYVQEAIAEWRSRALLAGAEGGRRVEKVEPPLPNLAVRESTQVRPLPNDSPARHYRVLEATYRVQFANSELETWVHPLLQHLELPASEDESPKHVTVSSEQDGYVIALNEVPVFQCAQVEEVGHLTSMAMFSEALRGTDDALSLHAGAVCQGDRAMILPGSAGSGKTTLTATLVHEGLHYLSDDLVLLDLENCAVRGVPFSLSVKEDGIGVLSHRFPCLRDLPVHVRPDQKRVRYLPLNPDWRASEPCDSPKISWIVFPTYDPRGANELAPMAPGKALVELTRGCTMMRRVRRDEVWGLISLIRYAQCLEIEVSSLNQAIDQLVKLWQDRV
jgi:hypothetical protein